MSNLLTGIRDVDREIVNKMSDSDFLQMCSLNQTYYQNVCSDDYFRIRTQDRFPETIAYKEYIQTTNKTKTWKNHYLTIVKYIDLLLTDYKYTYSPEDKSPELLYLTRKLLPNYYIYTKENVLYSASRHGHLPLVKYLVENGADINSEDGLALLEAAEYGHLPVVKYLVENGVYINAEDGDALSLAAEKGNLPIVKYLVENGGDIHAQNNQALRLAAEKRHLEIVKYLVENGANIHAENDQALILASKKGYLEIVQYLVENGANVALG